MATTASLSASRWRRFWRPGALLWVYVVLGAAVSVVAMLGTVNAVKPLGRSALTFPFVLTTWLLLLATYGFSGLAGTALPAGNVVTAFQPYEASPLNVGRSCPGGAPEHFASLPEGQRLWRRCTSARGARRELARCRRIRSSQARPGRRHGTSLSARKAN